MEELDTKREAIADANFIGWGRWAAKELLDSLTPRQPRKLAQPPNADAAAPPPPRLPDGQPQD